MSKNSLSKTEWVERIGAALLFLGVGSLIILVFSPWRPMINDRMDDYLLRIGLSAILLAAVLLAKRSARMEKFYPLLTGLLILSVAASMQLIMGRYLQNSLGVSDAQPSGWAALKLNEAFIAITIIILLTRTSGASLGSIYIQKGNLRLGLIIGLITFTLAVLGSFPMATLFKVEHLTLERVAPWTPWLLIYVLANAAFEELMFRGLFLRKLQPFLGKFLSNFITAFVFTGLHGTVTYSSNNLIFLAVTFPLALAWGYIMQKTDNVWGSILFHAGMDIPILLGIFANL